MSGDLNRNEPIAIVGSGCRFPGSASTKSKLWELLSQPRDVLSKIPPTRFNPDGFYHPDAEYSGHSNVLHSYILDEDHRAWDADFFGVSVQEAHAIDPQQRLLMECVYEALEDGGQRMHELRGSNTAVYVGLMCEEYSDIQGRELNTIPRYFPTGTARSIVANRISYFFDWRGASMTIDTACSSSLVAVHQAVQVLRSGGSRVAIAAGTNLILGPEPYIAESTFHMLSPQGRSHMWDAGADGYGRGDGVAAVVLKRLSDAIADGDSIDCIIRETGVNQDGRTNGITVPSADSQVALIEDTYQRAGLNLDTEADRPQFFEAHGTGTLAGDPLEAEAIHRAIGRRLYGDIAASSTTKLRVGSIKSIIGHTEGTAGLAGLLKASMAIRHGLIPPNLLFRQLNPAIEPFYKGLEVPISPIQWETVGNQPRRASVNSFGFGGTNAHAIIESYAPDTKNTRASPQSVVSCAVPYTFSAATKASLRRMLEDFAVFLEQRPNVSAHDLAYTLNARRSVLPFRVAYTSRGLLGLKEKVAAAASSPDWGSDTEVVRAPSSKSTRILGIFTGQGAQWAGMGRQLFDDLPFARTRLRDLEMALAALPSQDRPQWSLTTELLETDESKSKLNLAEYSQPLCTALQIVLVDLLAAANVHFSAVVGHSSGEIAAAYAAGILSARDAIVVAYYRGIYSNHAKSVSGKKGAMLAVGTSMIDAEEIVSLPRFEGRLSIAAHNSPTSVTISGDEDAIQEAQELFQDEGKFARTLRVDKAYHSHHMEPCTTPYVEALRRSSVKVSKPRQDCQWYSSVFNGARITGSTEEELNGTYWARNMAQTVLFATAVKRAVGSVESLFHIAVELGPHGALRGPFNDIVTSMDSSPPPYINCLRRGADSSESFGYALGQMWTRSVEGAVDLDKFQLVSHDIEKDSRYLLSDLPRYPWDNKRIFWHESRRSRALRARSEPGHPLLGTITPDSTGTDITWHNVLRIVDLPWLDGHQLQGQTVFPAAGYVALALEAAMFAAKARSAVPQRIEISNLSIGNAVVFESENVGIETLFSLTIQSPAENNEGKTIAASFRIRSAFGDKVDTVLNASGSFEISLKDDGLDAPEHQALLPPLGDEHPLMVDVDEDDFYSALKDLGYQYSKSFRALGSMKRKIGYGRGKLVKPISSDMHHSEKQLLVHPGLLDAAFQGIFLAYSWPGDGRLWSLHVPVSIQSIQFDVAECRTNKDRYLWMDSAITGDGSVNGQVGLSGDVDIFSEGSGNGMIQVAGINVVPFGAASESQDTQMFFTNHLGVAFPDGELAVHGDLGRATAEEIELGWLLERISHFYLKRLADEITPEEEARAEWHHQKLMDFSRHVSKSVSRGTLPYGKKEWVHDTAETLQTLMNASDDKIEIRLMRSVGEHLAAAVRGETIILEHMLKDGMLNQYYVESLGLNPYTDFLAEVIGQITHVNPRLRILEIGAGTGGATKRILRKIGNAFEQYTYTDISSGFFDTAKGVFSKQAATGAMSFEVLDAEKDIAEQGFKEQSYDLLIASLVLHATKDIQHTLRNVRRLLKPGGFLVMIEVTSNVTMRLSFTMGGLEGWWLGADTGRPWTPCISTTEWHDSLLQSGFSGVEASTPELETLPRPFGVLISRAVDERINLLITPSLETSPLSTIYELVIVAGTSLYTVRLAEALERILRKHCQTTRVVTGGVEALVSLKDSSTRLTLLYLGDLDKPAFEDLTPVAFSGLKTLFAHTHNLLWVTSGARSERPYSNMSLGVCRAMLMEQSHMRIQFLDFSGARLDAQMVADDLLRFIILVGMEQNTTDTDYLWTLEPEVTVDSDGRRWVPRIMPHSRFNHSYNSSHRTITADVDLSHDVIEIHKNSQRHGDCSLVRIGAVEDFSAASDSDSSLVRIRSLYSGSTGIQTSPSQTLYATIGTRLDSDEIVMALSAKLGSIIDAHELHIIPYDYQAGEAPARLRTTVNYLLANIICEEAVKEANTILVEPTEDLAQIVASFAKGRSLNISCVTTSAAKSSSAFTLITPHASNGTLRRRLLPSISNVIVFLDPQTQGDALARRLRAWLPETVTMQSGDRMQSRGGSINLLEILKEAAENYALNDSSDTNVMSAGEYSSMHHARDGVIIDWVINEKLSLTVRPTDASPLLRGDRTYLLVGLAGKGGLGLSLAEYFARQGARYIILTSRNPSVDDNDVTNETSLRKLVDNVRSSDSWPPIAGVANGAMVLNDITLQNMSYDQMTRVLKPKVEGTRFLDQIFYEDKLDFFLMFSSLSCVFGREGQTNYDAANMYLVSLAAQRRARGVCASVIDIGAIMGTGYMAREVSERTLAQLLGAGYRKMSERDFHIAFANGILAGRSKLESPELITGLYVASPDEEFTPAWAKNPRFAHVLLRKGIATDKSAAASAQMESTEDLLKRARTQKDVSRVIQFVVLHKMGTVLQLGAEVRNDHASLLQQHTSALGFDSLIAVEIRSWMMRELDVDIPVLKILSDVTVQDIVDFATENLPESLTPNLDPSAEDSSALEDLTRPRHDDQKVTTPAKPVGEEPSVSILVDLEPLTTSGQKVEPDSSSTSHWSYIEAEAEGSNQMTPSSDSPSQSKDLPSWAMDKAVPMSYGQSRFWLMSQVLEDPCVFNVTCDIEIKAEVDAAILSRAVQSLGARHEALRTCFLTDVEHGHEPVQKIMEESTLHLETVSATPSEVETHFSELHKNVYNLERGELMRIILVSSSHTRHHLLVGYHHVNMDSSSLAVLVYDLQRLYAGQQLPPPRVQSSDFALYQADRLHNGDWDKQINFWREELSMTPPPIPILDISPGANRPRPDRIAYDIHSDKTRVTAKVASQVQALCRRARVTPFHLYTTVLQVLVARLSNTNDFCIGMADANRSEIGAADSVGNFLNLLPLRLKLEMDQQFESILKRTREKALHVMSNSAVPFEIILEKIQPTRSAAHSPLYQVFIDYRQVTEKLPWGKGTLEGKKYLLSKTPYDIMLDVIDTPTGEASLEIMVQKGLYTPEDASKILGCYVNLLNAFSENSNMAVGEFMPLEQASILSTIDEIAATQPRSVALEDTLGNSLSWSEMVSKSAAVVEMLKRHNIPTNSRVGMLQEPTTDWICSMLGIWRSGNTYVPLEISQGVRRLGEIVKAARLTAVVIHDETAPLVAQLDLGDFVTVVNLSRLPSKPGSGMVNMPRVGLNDEAMVIYTSGSTGIPKGISIPHRVVRNAMQGMQSRWPMQPQTVLQQIALSFDMSWWGAILGLVTKGKVIVAGREARGDPRALTALLATRNITLTIAVSTEAVAWLQHGNLAALRSSRWAWHVATGEPFSLSLIKQLQTLNKHSLRVLNVYGPTETMIPTAHEVPYQTTTASDMPIPIGHVMANYTARVVDSYGQPVPAGVPGHLVFGGAGIASGYVDNPALNAERFPKDHLAGPVALGQKWDQVHLSGDRGYLRETDGMFILMGRIDGDTQIKLRGLRLDLLDIEANIISTSQDHISDVAVHLRKPLDHDTSSHFLAAHVVLAKNSVLQFPTETNRNTFLRRVIQDLPLPDYMRPTVIAAVEALPITPNGKLNRKALTTLPLHDMMTNSTAASQAQGHLSTTLQAGQSSIKKMEELWLSILVPLGHSASLSPTADFFLVGGNSLLLIRLQGELRKHHGLDVPLANLFQRSTLTQMAALLDASDSESITPSPGVDWVEETKLQPDLVHLRAPPRNHSIKDLVIVLTGASGFLGGETLRHLIARPEIKKIYCIAVRNTSSLVDISSPKVVIYPGDLSLPNLGMSEDAVRKVFSTADVVIHNGADTSFLKAYHSVRATNLGSTKEIVRLALQYRHVSDLHFISTAGISTLMSSDIYEEPLGAFPPKGATEGYVLSKWASELYLENVNTATSLPVTIHRPAAIVGPGAPRLDVMTNVLQFSKILRSVPSMSALEGTFQFVDVKDVAADILSAILSRGTTGRTGRSSNAVLYRNHGGKPADAVNVHSIGAYIGKKLDSPALPVLPDAEWISKAEASGMAPEVARYLEGMNLIDRKGQKWAFPMVWNGVRS
ncbi:hypothetical protein HD806DRAFT_552530 [Xylariaceae sp. AK1471]|nr:hypothetical protein HD806DRAFT_552530 [Xylariaceae sp. AK1471]